MKSEEAIKILKGTLSSIYQTNTSFEDSVTYKEASEIAIRAIKELQQYRAIGTVEQCKKSMSLWRYLRERHCGADKVIEKCMEYEQIGTVEECREAMEKQKAKYVKIEPWSPAHCPSCDYELSTHIGDGYYKHPTFLKRCPKCGQLITWERSANDGKTE